MKRGELGISITWFWVIVYTVLGPIFYYVEEIALKDYSMAWYETAPWILLKVFILTLPQFVGMFESLDKLMRSRASYIIFLWYHENHISAFADRHKNAIEASH